MLNLFLHMLVCTESNLARTDREAHDRIVSSAAIRACSGSAFVARMLRAPLWYVLLGVATNFFAHLCMFHCFARFARAACKRFVRADIVLLAASAACGFMAAERCSCCCQLHSEMPLTCACSEKDDKQRAFVRF